MSGFPLQRASNVGLVVSLNKLLNKQSSCQWFHTPVMSMWHHGDVQQNNFHVTSWWCTTKQLPCDIMVMYNKTTSMWHHGDVQQNNFHVTSWWCTTKQLPCDIMVMYNKTTSMWHHGDVQQNNLHDASVIKNNAWVTVNNNFWVTSEAICQ